MQDKLGTKTIGGMVAFLAQMVEKGRAREGVIKPLDTAIRKVFSVVAGEGWEAVDITSLDLDDYMLRFGNMTNGQYTTSSLSVYKSRIRKSLEWYDKFLTTPGWVPPVREVDKSTANKPKAAKAKVDSEVNPGSGTAPLSGMARADDAKPTDDMISYPLPLVSGKVVQLYLPTRLTQADARRISAFVSSLAFEEPESTAGRQ